MFKKRTRPASVRDKAAEPEPEAEASATPSEVGPDEDESASIEQMLQMRKFRRAQQGIELEKLNRGEGKKKKKGPVEIELDQFGLQPSAAGLRKEKEAEPTTESERAAHKVRSNNFTQQTNALDVDKHMMAYIDKEMAKRKGEATDEVQEEAADPREALYGLAERYQVEGLKVDSDDDGNVTNSIGMLSAIPEIDLGMENRLRNIEETERAKRELIETRKAEASAPREDDPLAGQRFYRGQQRETDIHREMAKARREAAGLDPAPHRERHHKPEMATDDAVYERFKKRMKR
ncbi:Telomere length and silencing protein 1 [Vanrija pseudolonga]|uniref:Telomere length and silencing protein 1 n=1 Tax=Vanrija pseudolonga TaxID=143232 RepID=A0AAF0YJ83_9TREE|nr:Telomere length and silencing protein 1 [Vanrija pseudolonga]